MPKLRNKQTGEIIDVPDRPVAQPASPVDRFLPGLEETEQVIKGRESPLVSIAKKFSDLSPGQRFMAFVPGISPDPEVVNLQMEFAGAPFQLAESAVANTLLTSQKGENEPSKLLDSFIEGASGRKQTQLGDVIRTTDFGGPLNEPIAATLGFIGSMGLTNLATKGKLVEGGRKVAESLRKTVKAIGRGREQRFLNKAQQFEDGISQVHKGLRYEFDQMYRKIGNNTIGGDDLAKLDEITQRLPSVTVNKVHALSDVKGTMRVLNSGKTVTQTNVNNAKIIKDKISQTIPDRVWSGLDSPTDVQLQLLDDYHALNKVIANSSGTSKKSLLSLNEKYSKFLDLRGTMRKSLRKGKDVGPGIRGIKAPGSAAELKAMREFGDQFFPQAEKILKDVDKINRSDMILKALGLTTTAAGATLAARKFLVDPLLKQGGGAGPSPSSFIE